MIRLAIIAALAAALLGGGWYARSVVSDRDALRVKVTQQKADIEEARQQAESAKQKAKKAAQDAARETKLREDIATKANARDEQIAEDLRHAEQQIAHWREQADPTLARCLDVVVPAGAVSVPPGPAYTHTGGSGGLRPATEPIHDARHSAGSSGSTDIQPAGQP